MSVVGKTIAGALALATCVMAVGGLVELWSDAPTTSFGGRIAATGGIVFVAVLLMVAIAAFASLNDSDGRA